MIETRSGHFDDENQNPKRASRYVCADCGTPSTSPYGSCDECGGGRRFLDDPEPDQPNWSATDGHIGPAITTLGQAMTEPSECLPLQNETIGDQAPMMSTSSCDSVTSCAAEAPRLVADRDQQVDPLARTGLQPQQVPAASTQDSTELVGYARAASTGLDLAGQSAQLKASGCTRIIRDESRAEDEIQGPGLREALDFIGGGDTLVVLDLPCLGRDTSGFLQLARDLAQRGAGLRVLSLVLDTLTSEGGLVLAVLSETLATDRGLAREKQRQGAARANHEGRTVGRPPTSADKRDLAVRLRTEGYTYEQIGLRIGRTARTARRIVVERLARTEARRLGNEF